MTTYEVKGMRLSKRASSPPADHHIEVLCGIIGPRPPTDPLPPREPWCMCVHQVLRHIDAGDTFFVSVPKAQPAFVEPVPVDPSDMTNVPRYVRARLDPSTRNNLLSLPDGCACKCDCIEP